MASQRDNKSYIQTDEDVIILWCDKQSIRAHKRILSAASEFFKDLLQNVPNTHPFIVFVDMKFVDLYEIVQYIYSRKTTNENRGRSSFLDAARKLHISFAEDDLEIPEAKSEFNIAGLGQTALENDRKKSGTAECRSTISRATFVTKMQAIFEYLKIDEVDEAIEKLLMLQEIRTTECASLVMHLAAEKAIDYVSQGTVIGRLCKHLIERDSQFTNTYLFYNALIHKCQSLFDAVMDHTQCSNIKRRLRCLGIVRFIGVLYMYRIFPAKIISGITSLLLSSPVDDNLLYVYELLCIVGKRIERIGSDEQICDLSEQYRTIDVILYSKETEIHPDIRKLLRKLIRNRKNNWRKSNKLLLGDYGPVLRKSAMVNANQAASSKRQQHKHNPQFSNYG